MQADEQLPLVQTLEFRTKMKDVLLDKRARHAHSLVAQNFKHAALFA
jgi:hypothetical protein